MPNPVLHQINVLGSVLSSTLGNWRGANALVSTAAQPALPIRLYDMEVSPYCRAVREAFTALHLDVEIYPCPKGGTRFRPEAERLGGKQQFPLLVDPNTNTVMYESAHIVDYLFRIYGNGRVPSAYRKTLLKTPAAFVASAVRGARGMRVRPSHAPAKMLELWSFEASPYARLVRERLTELELPYLLHNIGKERWQDIGPAVLRLKPGPYQPIPGGKRDQHFRRTSHMQVPYLEDPNTGVKMLESAKIIDYLESTYAL
ncbi:MAG: glutathione S-transferase N-terminal domain-containing protein [bacterium]|nr:glutathione S-transferase N-terminal domain-containing protein [bacterium]